MVQATKKIRLKLKEKTYLAWHVWLGRQQEQIVDWVDYVLGANVLFAFLDSGNGSVHAHMGDTFERIIIVLQHEWASKWQDQVLQEVNGGFAAEHEVAVLE